MSIYCFSSRTPSSSRNRFFSTLFALCCLLATPGYATFVQDPSTCLDAPSVALDATTRFTGFDVTSPYFRVDVPSAGLLSVRVSALDLAELTLDLNGGDCDAHKGRDFAVVERSAAHLVVNVFRSGSYTFRIGTDPLAPPLERKIQTAFVGYVSPPVGTEAGEDEDEIEVEPDPVRAGGWELRRMRTAGLASASSSGAGDAGEDEDEIEVEPDPLQDSSSQSHFAPGSTPLSADATETQGGTGDAGEDEDEIEVEPDPLLGPGLPASSTLGSKLQELCRQGSFDDHGDMATCATFVPHGQEAYGTLSNGFGDDEDAFTFLVGSERSPVSITITSEVELVAGLYDQAGRLVERLVRGEREVQVTRALATGTYLIRLIGSHGGEGSYGLSVTSTQQ